MNEIRVVIAILLFFTNGYLIFDLAANGFAWGLLFIILVLFVLIHYIWPKDYKKDSAWLELIELVIDLPFRMIASFLRGLGRLFRSSDGIDIDI